MVQTVIGETKEKSFQLWSNIMVAICFVTGIVAYGGGRYSFGVFIKPMTEALGWTRTQISLGATINLICYAIASPIVGRMLDKWGVRHTVLIGSVIVGSGFCGMYFINSLWVFYLLFGVVAALGINMVGRIAQATIVANWFVKKRGLMMGVTALSIGIGTTLMAPAANAVLLSIGWQSAFLFLGGMFFLFIFFPVFFLVKGKGLPEDRGFGPDGISIEAPSAKTQSTTAVNKNSEEGWTASEALRTVTLWGIFVAMGLSYMADYIVLFHGIPCFQDRGLSSGIATSILATATLVSCIGRLGFGWLADRLNMRVCMALMFGFQIFASPLLIMGGSNTTLLYTFAALWGIGYGAFATLMPAISSQYFGRLQFGTIYGFVTMATVIGGAMGSTLGGWIYDVKGNYDLAWYACIAMWVVACIVVFAFVRKPVRGRLIDRA
jgi:MFS family permease